MNIVLLLFLAADLSTIKAVPDLDKRSEMALANAGDDIDVARDAYKAGDLDKVRQALEDIKNSVNLAAESLDQSSRQPRKSKYFKSAELKTRALARRLKAFSDEISVDDRKPVEDVHQRVQEVHDRLLDAIMRNKK